MLGAVDGCVGKCTPVPSRRVAGLYVDTNGTGPAPAPLFDLRLHNTRLVSNDTYQGEVGA